MPPPQAGATHIGSLILGLVFGCGLHHCLLATKSSAVPAASAGGQRSTISSAAASWWHYQSDAERPGALQLPQHQSPCQGCLRASTPGLDWQLFATKDLVGAW